jgi:adenine-specific DNA-methyltransferase
MLVAFNLDSKAEEIIKQANQFAARIMKEMSLKEETAGRLAYYLILKELALKLKEQFLFKESLMEELSSKVAHRVEVEVERIIENPDLLDLLYEKLVTSNYRKKYGQFLTPAYIAEFMASWVNQNNPSTIIDPAVGSGIFLDKIVKTSNSLSISLWGLDIDPVLLTACYVRLKLRGVPNNLLHLSRQDFLKIGRLLYGGIDAVICNPPYLNFHDFDRDELVSSIENLYNIKLSRLTNIYVLFFIQSLYIAKKGAKLAFITPSEFLYTGYGEELKAFLLKHTTIDSMILIDFQSLVFNTALTTAIITLFRKGLPPPGHKVKFIRIYKWPTTSELLKAVNEGFENPEKYQIIEVYQDELKPKEKWLKYFTNIDYADIIDKLVPLSQLADVDRGIATGFNEYFVLRKSEVDKWGIENEFVVPVISNAAQCKGYNFTNDDWNRMVQKNEKCFLLYVFKEPSSNLLKYIKYGEKIKANQRYLTQHRSPWYSMEKREPAKILATVFHRERMRFILNEAGVRNLTAFHCIYPKFDNILMVKALLAYLNSDLCKQIQTIKRREYGGGLHKFEPKDLENIPTLDVTKLSISDLESLASAFDELCITFRKGADETPVRRKIDSILRYIILKSAET